MIEPKPFKKKITDKTVCVMDTETDPFGLDEFDEPIRVEPFSVGFYDGATYHQFWGDDCIDQFFRFLEGNYEPGTLIIFAHNGGRFDFMFCLEWLNEGQSPFMIDGKIVAAMFGGQQFRDSYKLMPFPLAEYKKTEIDYDKFKREVRQKHKREIQAYQRDDCLDLYSLVSTFFEEYGDRLTIASTSLPLLNSYHGFEKLSEWQDETFRQFYFGGRVQCFAGGLIRRKLKVVDVNAMYPYVMKTYTHPVGRNLYLSAIVTKDTYFVCLVAQNNGAFCRRDEDFALNFTDPEGEFFVTIHEYRAGLKTGTMHPRMIKHCWNCEDATSFDTFVDHFYGMRLHYKEIGDKARALFIKYILNSSYGKFAQDPRRYEEFKINEGDCPEDKEGWPDIRDDITNPGGWRVHSENEGLFIWSRDSKNKHRSYKNVATGASITGAARAELLLGISKAKTPIYCDTDSIICEDFPANMIDPDRLGGWKVEAEGCLAAIAGKKLYAIFSEVEPAKRVDKDDDGIVIDPRLGRLYCIKKASKGCKLSAAEIYDIAQGGSVHYVNPVPAFQLDGSVKKTARTIERTV